MFGKLLQKLTGKSKFQGQVLETLGISLPGHRFEPGPDEHSIRMNGIVIALQELQQKCLRNETETKTLIQQHFSHLAILIPSSSSQLSWNEASELVRLQFFPSKYRDLVPVVAYPFSDDVSIGIVLQNETVPRFILKTEPESWGVGLEPLYERALQNLDAQKMEIETTITDGADRFIGMETHDGYDAVRILLPRLRTLALGKLGESYFAGIPNRDFLILWSRNCSRRFSDYALEKIETDLEIQPYPLTRTVFEVASASIQPAKLS